MATSKKQNCRIWSEANPQVYVETSLHPEKLTVWCALWARGIIGPYFFENYEGYNVTLNATRGLLATDHVILNHGQVTWTTPELAPPLLTTTPHQRDDVSALDRFNVHRCPTRRVFSGTGIELMTCLPWLDTLTTGLPQPQRLPWTCLAEQSISKECL
ncbi:uncharacterized protein TNCV_983501 [Trichonephila clavipes]|nr:uncharacterized protein TNCV_983501 [Trichonephila clavipes]